MIGHMTLSANFRRWRRWLLLTGGLIIAYLAVCVYPQPLFAYTMRQDGIVVHSTQPIPEEMRAVVGRAQQRLQRTVIYDRTKECHVFYCDSRWLFTLFARSKYRAGGIAAILLGQSVFLRGGDLINDRMISFSGKPIPANRPLSYFLAHELMHIAQARALGIFGYSTLPTWVDDGYADYVARDIDYDRTLQEFKEGTTDLDPTKSGLYLRYQLMVAYLIEKKATAPIELLQRKDNGREVERDLNHLDGW
jgi:hypothetical protein